MPLSAEASVWASHVAAGTAIKARGCARTVAARLRDRDHLLLLNRDAARQSRYPDTLHWSPCGLAHGDAGLALAHAFFDRCFEGENWGQVAGNFLQASIAATPPSSPQAGLFGGATGLAFAIRRQVAVNAEHDGWLAAFDQTLAPRVLEMAGRLHGRHGVAVSEFDVISGLAGIGVYLLTSDQTPPLDVAWQALLDALVALTRTTDGVPHWYTPAHAMGDSSMKLSYPKGNLNCGLAHGIPGPLALMALAAGRGTWDGGPADDQLLDAIHRTADWIVRQRCEDEFGVNWPTVVPWTANGQTDGGCYGGSRAAWCYGAPGLSRALWLAAGALDDAALRELAVESMAAVYRRPLVRRQIDSPTFCHGVAGLLQVTLRFAHDTGLSLFDDAADELCRQLLSAFGEEHPFGFQSIEPEGNAVDQCGLLDGAAGVALVLLAAAGDEPPDWDRAFLLS